MGAGGRAGVALRVCLSVYAGPVVCAREDRDTETETETKTKTARDSESEKEREKRKRE